jgi:hypothetical protein
MNRDGEDEEEDEEEDEQQREDVTAEACRQLPQGSSAAGDCTPALAEGTVAAPCPWLQGCLAERAAIGY